MPDPGRSIVLNTTPLISVAVATEGLDILRLLYDRIIVPLEVEQEILAAGSSAAGVKALLDAQWIERLAAP